MTSIGPQFPSRLELTLAIRAALPERASLETIAGLLRITPRTLQRRLAGHGLTLSDEVARVRRERAVALLEEGSLSISRIGQLVGFANLSSFSRAFRSWTGVSPRTYRRLHCAGTNGKVEGPRIDSGVSGLG